MDRIVLSFASLSAAAIAATALAAASKPAAAEPALAASLAATASPIATTLAPPIATTLASPIATTLASPIAAALASTAPVAPSLAAKTSRAAPTSHAARPKCGQLQKLPTDKSRLLLASGRVRSHQSQPLRPLRDGDANWRPRGGRIHRPQQSNLLDAGQLRRSGAQPVLRCGHCASNATSFASCAPIPTNAP